MITTLQSFIIVSRMSIDTRLLRNDLIQFSMFLFCFFFVSIETNQHLEKSAALRVDSFSVELYNLETRKTKKEEFLLQQTVVDA